MTGNIPTKSTDTAPIASNSPLKNTMAGVALATLALVGQPASAAETTARFEAARQSCIAKTKIEKAGLLKMMESKRAAGEMDKVAKMEEAFNK